MKVMRYDPASEFISLREAVDKLFADSFIRPFDGFGAAFPVDVYETPEMFVVKAALPGIKPEQLSVDATADSLTIKAELKDETEIKEAQYLRKERRYGKFQRVLALPLDIEPGKVEATFEHGVVTVKLPKSEVVKAKHIAIKSAP